MNFDSFLTQIRDGQTSVSITEEWMQGRAAFGGLVAAIVYEAMVKKLAGGAPVRCLQISFVGPVDGSTLDVESEVLREGKNVSHVIGYGKQNGQTKVVVQGSFGAARESMIQVDASLLELSAGEDKAQKMPYIPGVTPAFTQNFDFRYVTGLPFSGVKTEFLEGMVRFSEPTESMRESHILGLVDAWPPTTLPMITKPCAASSLSWTIEFLQPGPGLSVDELALYRAEIVHSADGYGYARAKMANSSGELIAISQQTVTHFA